MLQVKKSSWKRCLSVWGHAEVLKKIISHLFEIAKEEAEKDKANHGKSELT